MVCKFCKEEVKDGASKCPTCGEYLGARGAWHAAVWAVGVLIPVVSIALAVIEYSGRVRAETEKKVVEGEFASARKQAEVTRDVFQTVQDSLKARLARLGIQGAAAAGEIPDVDSIVIDLARPARPPSRQNPVLSRADTALSQRRWSEAEQLLKRARMELQGKPEGSDEALSQISASLGYVYLKKGDLTIARAELERAVKEDTSNVEARRNLALTEIVR